MAVRHLVKRRWAVAVGLAFTTIVAMLEMSTNPLVQKYLDRLDYVLYDLRFEVLLGQKKSEMSNIYIADIDEKSLKAHGQWPWSRKTIAKFIEELSLAEVKVVAFDVVFAEPEVNSVDKLLDDLEIRGKLTSEVSDKISPLKSEVDNDQYLAGYLRKTKVILGYVFHDDQVQVGKLGRPVNQLRGDLNEKLTVRHMTGYAAALRVLQRRARDGGFINVVPDNDGIIRRVPLVIRHGNAIYPALSLAAAQHFLDVRRIKPEYEEYGESINFLGITLGDRLIKTDRRSHLTIGYRGPGKTFPYVSIADIIAGKYRNGELKDSLIFVGTTVKGLSDLRATPLDQNYPGVEIHASIVDSIINDNIVTKPHWEFSALIGVLFGLGVILSLIQPFLRPMWLLFTGLGSLALVIFANFEFWMLRDFDLTLIGPVVLVLAILSWNLLFNLIRESVHREEVTSMFGQYVPANYVDQMIQSPESFNMEGESKELTVMFGDIRGFTNMSEKLTAAELKRVLNRFFTPVTGAIFDNQGTIDKYVGDMVMAFWGAPIDDPEHRKHALEAAFAIKACIVELKKEFAEEGLPNIDMGVGLNSGIMNVGDMGSSYRRAYTVLGDSVNLGSRVESLTKFYGSELLITEYTREGVDGFVYRYVDYIRVKGKEEPVTLFEPVLPMAEASEAMIAAVDRFNAVIEQYKQRQWSAVIEALESLRENPEFQNTRLLELYLERAQEFQDNDPGEDWDGVYTHLSK